MPPAASAQDAFARMMKEEIGPALRRLGFRGSGQRFVLPSDSAWATLGVQKSACSDPEELTFTLNLAVIGHAEWEQARAERPYLPERPSASTFYHVGWQSRIGALMPGNLDRWWSVRGEASTQAVSREVLDAIEQFALPALRARLPRQG